MSPRPAGTGRPVRTGRGGRVSPARLVAYDVLRDVDDRDAYANLALPARIREAGLAGREAALATELAAGTLRLRGRYDRIIELASGRRIDEVDSRTRNVLRLGVHQVLGMRTAGHAAVNESVELQRRVANERAAGFVNGVLRAVNRATNAEWDARIAEAAANSDEARAAVTSHPAWVLRALRDALRVEGRTDELPDLLAADNTAPRVSLALLPGSGIDAETAEALGGTADGGSALRARGPSPIGLELSGGDPARAVEALEVPEGTVRVQDQGSQLAALALARAPLGEAAAPAGSARSSAAAPSAAAADPAAPSTRGSAERWLDLCAGPGGKTAVLAAEAALAGARLRANEVSEHRAELVRGAVVAHAEEVEVCVHDGRDDAAFGGAEAKFDRILVDAPCSGLGALRRRPEARWRKRPEDLPGLTALQGELLDAAVRHLAPGGVIAYVTCSPHVAETSVVVRDALRRHPQLHELDAAAVVREAARGSLDLPEGRRSVQLWPHRHGTDAMFIALLGG